MKTIQDFQTFNESLTNNISFGGSYLGRLFNSAIRLGKSVISSLRVSGKKWRDPMYSLISSVPNLFNEDDILSNALDNDSQTRIFSKKIDSIIKSCGGNVTDKERKQIINLIDEHQLYIKNFKKSSLKGLKKVLMKYKLELIFELQEVQDFKNKYRNLNPNIQTSVDDYNTSIRTLIIDIENTNLGLKYSNSLKKFKKTLENSKK